MLGPISLKWGSPCMFPEIAVDGLKDAENTNTLHGMYGIEILREIEYQHREGDRCSPAYLN